jgi:hypothetical protein
MSPDSRPTSQRIAAKLKQWDIRAVDNSPLYRVQMAGLAHFTDMTPLPGLTALCGAKIVEDDTEVKLTCPVCAQIFCKVKMPALPGADEGGAIKPPVKA